MKIEQITALKDAGFTSEQIVALAPILTEEPPKQEPEKYTMDEMMFSMKKQFEDMMKAVQGAMINVSRQADTEMTAEDVAASILDPGRNRGKK